MTAKLQYKYYRHRIREERASLNKEIATMLLKIPIPMSYDVWRGLHMIKGDWK